MRQVEATLPSVQRGDRIASVEGREGSAEELFAALGAAVLPGTLGAGEREHPSGKYRWISNPAGRSVRTYILYAP